MHIDKTIDSILKEFSSDEMTGVCGAVDDHDIVQEIEESLGVTLSEEANHFARTYGAFQVGRYCMNFLRDESDNVIDMTIEARERYPGLLDKMIVILKDELVYFLLNCDDGTVAKWEYYTEPRQQNFLQHFGALSEFIEEMARWVRSGG